MKKKGVKIGLMALGYLQKKKKNQKGIMVINFGVNEHGGRRNQTRSQNRKWVWIYRLLTYIFDSLFIHNHEIGCGVLNKKENQKA